MPRKLTKEESKRWKQEQLNKAFERAQTAVDCSLHGIAISDLYNQGILTDREAHIFVAYAMVKELHDHDLYGEATENEYRAILKKINWSGEY